MNDSRPPPCPLPDAGRGPERLLAEGDWVRHLARRLVDANQAEDLAQAALLRGLEEPPQAGWPMRSWLGGVVRNLARQERRAGRRREGREAAAARPERLPPVDEALARLQEHEGVVRAVLALEEPYRTTVVLRFYDDLPPRRIAQRTGVPVETVKTRLARAITKLRARLDREHGSDGRSWAVALIPLARLHPGALLIGPGSIMPLSLKIALPLTALALFLVWRDRTEPDRAASEEPVQRGVVQPAEVELARALPMEAPRVPSVPQPVEPAHETPPEPDWMEGRVIDTTGRGVSSVRLGLRASNGSGGVGDEAFGYAIWRDPFPTGDPVAVSQADGGFRVDIAEHPFSRVVSQDEHWETVLAPWVGSASSESLNVVVSPRLRLRGRVEDVHGAPVSGARVSLGVLRARAYVAGVDLTDTLSPGWSTSSDDLGRFSFERAPDVAGALLRVALEPFETLIVAREDWSEEEIVLVLREPDAPCVVGLVEHRGHPVPGARVSVGADHTRSADDGTFRLFLTTSADEVELLAIAADHRSARYRGDPGADGRVRWPSFVRLELGPAPLAISGTVVDAEGAPLAGQEIWLADGTVLAEGTIPTLLEATLAGTPSYIHGTTSDDQGRFALGGLEERDYSLRIVDPESTILIEVGPFAAGSEGLTLRQRTDLVWPRLRGQVLSARGQGLAGMHLGVSREVDVVGRDGTTYFIHQVSTRSVQADDSGRFELTRIAEGSTLSVFGNSIVDPDLLLTPDLDREDLRLVVECWVKLSVAARGAYAHASAFQLLDATAEPVPLMWAMQGGRMRGGSCPLVDGESTVVECADRARTLVLYEDMEELTRVPVVLVPDQVNHIEL